jgi:peptidyl-tRNA hydrolase, PTH1 family
LNPDFLIVGLGNPGKKYKKTRHNVGFMVCDYISSFFEVDFRFGPGNSQIIQHNFGDLNVVIAKPLTYMNLSGETVRKLIDDYGLELHQLMIISDDFSLPLGTLRVRTSGSSGNHNGLQSIIGQLGSNNFPRMRVGILGDDLLEDSVDFVLGNFRASELKIINRLVPVCLDAVRSWMFDGIDKMMSNYNKHYDFAGE